MFRNKEFLELVTLELEYMNIHSFARLTLIHELVFIYSIIFRTISFYTD